MLGALPRDVGACSDRARNCKVLNRRCFPFDSDLRRLLALALRSPSATRRHAGASSRMRPPLPNLPPTVSARNLQKKDLVCTAYASYPSGPVARLSTCPPSRVRNLRTRSGPALALRMGDPAVIECSRRRGMPHAHERLLPTHERAGGRRTRWETSLVPNTHPGSLGCGCWCGRTAKLADMAEHLKK